MTFKTMPVFFAAVLGIFSSGCFGPDREPERLDDKITSLPKAAGERSVPAWGFSDLSGKWATEQTEFSVIRTEDGFRLEVVCFGNMKDHESRKTDRKDDDMKLFSGEHVEVQVSPNGTVDGVYYHFAMNQSCSVYHARKKDVKWTPEGFSCSAEVGKDSWKAVMDFKWKTFERNKPPKDGEVWNINVCRSIKKKGLPAEHTSWTGASNFHDIFTMGRMKISGKQADQTLRVYRFGINGEGLLEIEAEKTGTEDGTLQVFDEGEFLVSQKISGTDKVRFTCKRKNNYVGLKDARKISIYLFGRYRVPQQAFSGRLKTDPGSFMMPDKFEYSGQSELICTVKDTPGKFKIKKEEETLLEQDASEKENRIPIGSLEPGRYVLEYSSGSKRSSRVFYIGEKPLPELPAFPKKCKLRVRETYLTVADVPTFLFGISGGSKTYFPSNPGFSLQYGNGTRKYPVQLHFFPGKRFVRTPAYGHAYAKDWETVIGNYLKKTKKSELPTLRDICYEANLGVLRTREDGSLEPVPDCGKFYGRIYRMAKEELPDDVISIHSDDLGMAADFADACDAFEYASWASSYHRENMLLHFEEDFDHVRNALKTKPIIPWLGGSIPDPECRAAEELRAGVYLTVLKGGAGNIIHMGHGGIPPKRTRFWSMLSMLPREIESFYADLRTWKPAELALPEGFVGRAAEGPDGELLAVILNTSAMEKKIEVELPCGYGKRELTFTPFEPRIIRCKKQSAVPDTEPGKTNSVAEPAPNADAKSE